MKKLIDLKDAFSANELLSIAATTHIKGGDGSTAADEENRRQRPGGGTSTNRPSGNNNGRG